MSVCQSKKRAYGERVARRYAKRLGQRPYVCQMCGFWHLTSQPLMTPSERRRRRVAP